MTTRRIFRQIQALFSCLLFIFSISCSDDESSEPNGNNSNDPSDSAGGSCTIDEVQPCPCDDGSTGNKTCLDGANFSECQCDNSPIGGDPGPVGGDQGRISGGTSPSIADSGTVDTGPVDPVITPSIDAGNTDMGDGGTTTDPGTNPPLGDSVSIAEVACGPLQGLNSPPVSIGARDVLINYPCDRPKGTKVTFILNLHGTQADEGLKFYQHAYLGAFNYVTSHNFIVASPKSVVSQWGNGDGGVDRPHINEVVDWVYQTFTDFDIVSMWVAGHSWGAMYTRGLVCEFQQTRGAVLQSGGAQLPACADRLSIIASVGETDIAPGSPDQSAIAAAHGCDASTEYMLGNNRVTEWANCDPGWSHKNYFMLGKGHGFVPTDWPDADMTEDIANAIRDAM